MPETEPTAAPQDALDPPVCSGKGCRENAEWALVWNNPRLHTPERRKVWLACDDHREHLTTFLSARSFLREVVPLSSLPADELPG
jgi:hypothetical protein